MGIEIIWRSQQGKRTEDNRDYCGIGLRRNEALCIVLDGFTKGTKGGKLSREIACALIDWFVDDSVRITEQILIERLRQIHENLSKKFPKDSASYIIIHIEDGQSVLVLHAGDCLLALYDGKHPTQWQTQPHTLANFDKVVPIDELLRDAARNRLTRSFKNFFLAHTVTGYIFIAFRDTAINTITMAII